MKNLITLLTLIAFLPSCDKKTTISNKIDNQTQKIDNQAIIVNQNNKPKSINTQYGPDYYFVVAFYKSVFYGNSLENLSEINIESAQLDLSPDGKKIAYSTYQNGRQNIKLIEIDTKKEDLLSLPEFGTIMGAWNRDGKHIVISCTNQETNFYSQPVIYDLDNNKMIYVSWLKSNTDYYNPTFSPNGKKLVFHDIERIYICDFNDGKVDLDKTISCEELCKFDNLGFSDLCKFQLTSDSKYLVFSAEIDVTLDNMCPNLMLFSLNLNNGNIKQLTQSNITIADFVVAAGNEIYFCTCDKINNIYGGYFSRLDNSNPICVTTFSEQPFAISIAE
ncbi:MAG: hypothetical protein MJ211_07060 [Bacteroidales bacterium]|nr:hypothetical protein [Bacteroidales bacterium]